MKALTIMFLTLCTTILVHAQNPTPATAVTSTIATNAGVGSLVVARSSVYSIVSSITVDAPAAGTFTCAITDICTKASHGYYTGLKVALTTSNTLPAGLSVTNFYIIRLSASTFSFATTAALAAAGTAVDITDTGTGTHTSTPASIAGASLKLQGSNDGTVWVDLPIKATGDATKSASITVTADFYLAESPVSTNYIRVYYTLTAGQIIISQVAKVRQASTSPF